MLETGTKAPDFLLRDQNGTVHTLSEYKGKKIILYFYPKDNTSGCSRQAVGYSERTEKFREKGIEVIGISKDSVSSHKKFETNYDLKFTLLSDTELSAIKNYDVWKEKKFCGRTSMGVVRTTYVIDEDGIIVYSDDKVKASEDAEKLFGLV